MKKVLPSLFAAAMLVLVLLPAAKAGAAASLVINGTNLPTATVGRSYSASVPFTYSGNYALNATWTGLPSGIVGEGLASNPNTELGILPGLETKISISGTPTQAGTYSVQLSMTDQYGATASQYFNLVASQAATLTITGNSLPNGTVGQPYSATIPYSYNGQAGLNATWTGLPSGIIGQGLPSDPDHVMGMMGNLISLTLSGMPTQAGTYTVTVQMTDQGAINASKTFTLTVNNPAVVNVANSPSNGPAHADYSNVAGPDGTVYRIENGARYPYTSAGAFLSYGFNSWSNVLPATAGDIQLPLATYTPSGQTQAVTYFIPPRNGSLINDQGTIYLITNGTRVGFVSAQTFLDLGYSFANCQPGDTSFMETLAPINSAEMAHPDGTLIRDNKTVYLMQNNAKMGIPSMQVFYSWGLDMNDVVPANSHDQTVPVSGVLNTRMDNQLNV